MSCSPSNSMPLSMTWADPRASSSEPVPVAVGTSGCPGRRRGPRPRAGQRGQGQPDHATDRRAAGGSDNPQRLDLVRDEPGPLLEQQGGGAGDHRGRLRAATATGEAGGHHRQRVLQVHVGAGVAQADDRPRHSQAALGQLLPGWLLERRPVRAVQGHTVRGNDPMIRIPLIRMPLIRIRPSSPRLGRARVAGVRSLLVDGPGPSCATCTSMPWGRNGGRSQCQHVSSSRA
jgi:hypothetical protein